MIHTGWQVLLNSDLNYVIIAKIIMGNRIKMKIWHLTDLHLDFGKLKIINYPEADVVVLNGDISHKMGAWIFIEKLLAKNYKVIFILGNHEYHNVSKKNILTMLEIEQKWKDKESKYENFHVLINETLIIDNYRFIGATLWTDFNKASNKTMVDFDTEMTDSISIYKSYKGTKYSRKGGININSKDILNIHYESKLFLEKELKKDFKGFTVVLTHHAPSFKSISDKYKEDSVSNGSFASDLEDIIKENKIDIWFHGHVHHSLNYLLYGTLIHCNPRGYMLENEINIEFKLNNVLTLK
jgi:Icc-related predicted phosphoesterase